jgi:hypothetical protein
MGLHHTCVIKMNIKEIAARANWSSVEKRPTWGTVSTKELSQILNIPMTTLGNWQVRGRLPTPEPHRRGQGNKNHYRISTIKKWLYGTPEEETHWGFINTHMGDGFESIEQAMWNAERHWKAFGIERVQ